MRKFGVKIFSDTSPEKKTATPQTKILVMVWWGLALGLAAGCFLNSISGFDWVHFYYPRGRDFAPEIVVNPLWVYLVIAPIALLPMKEAFAVFSLLNVVLLWLISRLSGAPRFLLLFSFPALWVLWFGQLDNFVALGVALGWWAVERRKGAWLGPALLLLLVKPHIGGPLALAYLAWSRDWRAVATAGGIFLLSLVIWRPDWPWLWVQDLLRVANPPAGVPPTADQETNITLYPYGLLAWPLVFLPMPRLKRAMAILSATFLSIPYAPTYSLIALLALPGPWWLYVISSLPLVLGPDGYWLTVLAPLGCLAWLAGQYLPGVIRQARPKKPAFNAAGPTGEERRTLSSDQEQ